LSEKLGYGPYSCEVTVQEKREKTFIVCYEKDIGEAYALIEERIENNTLDMSDTCFEQVIIS